MRKIAASRNYRLFKKATADAPENPHAGKSVEEIVRWHADRWGKNISDYSQIMPPDLIDYVINTMMEGVIGTMRDPETREEYYSHLSDEEYERLISDLGFERRDASLRLSSLR